MVLGSQFPDVVVPEVNNFGEYILGRLLEFKNKTALISADYGATYTYEELHQQVVDLCHLFKRININERGVVCLCLPNIPQFVSLFLATACCGAILTTCNPNYKPDEIRKQLVDAQPCVVFATPENSSAVHSASTGLEFVENIIVVGAKEGFTNLSSLLQQHVTTSTSSHQPVHVDVHQRILALPYSSGTTGKPKGVILNHYNFISATIVNRLNWSSTVTDVEYLVLPMFHIYGMVRAFSVLDQGAALVLQKRFSLTNLGKAVEKYKVTVAPLVPPMLLLLAKSKLNEKYKMETLKTLFIGAAPIPLTVINSVCKSYNCVVNQGWGMTETTGVSVILSLMGMRMKSDSGSILCSMHQAKICDVETREEVGRGVTGEILVRGPSIMMGYYNNPQATEATLESDGFMRTGDLGYFDENGRIFIVDRLKELIKYKGFQVAPAEIEEVLLRHKLITDAAVIGVPDQEAGELPKAFVVKKRNSLTSEMVHNFVKDKLSSYKHLRGGVEFIDQIPKSASGKILRRFLRDRELNKRKSSSKL